MAKLTLDIDANERNHLNRAVKAYYARMILADAEPGMMSPTPAGLQATQLLFGKVTKATAEADGRGQ